MREGCPENGVHLGFLRRGLFPFAPSVLLCFMCEAFSVCSPSLFVFLGDVFVCCAVLSSRPDLPPRAPRALFQLSHLAMAKTFKVGDAIWYRFKSGELAGEVTHVLNAEKVEINLHGGFMISFHVH